MSDDDAIRKFLHYAQYDCFVAGKNYLSKIYTLEEINALIPERYQQHFVYAVRKDNVPVKRVIINGGAYDPRIVSLGLVYANLNSLPRRIDRLTSLQRLNLESNNLESISPRIGKLSSLIELSVKWNNLLSLPAEIGNLQQLQELDLDGNKLSSLPQEIGNRITNCQDYPRKSAICNNSKICIWIAINCATYPRKLAI